MSSVVPPVSSPVSGSAAGLIASSVSQRAIPADRPIASVRPWMQWTLVAAGIYNLAWGSVAILAPKLSFELVGMELPRYLEFWQCIGMIVGVYGIGYLVAATNPIRHWPITLVGLLGKVFGPIGFAEALWSGKLPLAFGWNIITNDLIWWLPFTAILLAAWKARGVSGD
jgi:small multidrug resistance pump